jgi:hypothetical protein
LPTEDLQAREADIAGRLRQFNQTAQEFIATKKQENPSYGLVDLMTENPHIESALNDLFDEHQGILAEKSKKSFDLYHRLAGEVEARNVSARMNYSATSRTLHPPWKSQEFPADQQIGTDYRSGGIVNGQ